MVGYLKMPGVIKTGVQAEGIICMHALGVMAKICVHDSPTGRLRDVDLRHGHVGVAIHL